MKASFQFPRDRARARDARERAAPSRLDAPRAIRGATFCFDEISGRATGGSFQVFQLARVARRLALAPRRAVAVERHDAAQTVVQREEETFLFLRGGSAE